MTARHADDCDYHCDQYPHECTCGVSNPKEPDTMSNETQTTPANPIDTDDNGNPVATQAPVADNLTIENVQAAVAALTANDGAPASPLLTREEMAEPVIETVDAEPKTLAPEPAPERENVWNIHLQAWV